MSHYANIMSQLKLDAKCNAIRKEFENIYRHQMRYQPLKYQKDFGLSDADVKLIQNHYEDVDYPARLVVVNLPYNPADVGQMTYHEKAIRASSKVYMDEVLVTFEMGDSGIHPHYNYLFLKSVDWLARSRIIDNFSNTFGISKNFIDVTNLTMGDYMYKTDEYIEKEHLWTMDKRSPSIRKRKGRKYPSRQFLS